MSDTVYEERIEITAADAAEILGRFDQYAKKIERAFHVSVIMRDGTLRILGSKNAISRARGVVEELISLRTGGTEITEQAVNYRISMYLSESEQLLSGLEKEFICHTVTGRVVAPKTVGQREYVNSIRSNMITFGIGPAGTGKTYLAMAMAITAFRNEEVSRIILTRPAIEAGEKLGFLPGDLQSKIDPYLRPLYDALYQIMGAENFVKNMEKGLIEVAPLAYMRGRTLDNAYIILDEAQNTTQAQMKMFLTRIGFGSKVIVTGDMTQKDLPQGVRSGLDVAVEVLRNIEGIALCTLTSKDVVRHPLVQQIVEAYDKYEKKQGVRQENRHRTRNHRSGGNRQ